MARVADPDVGGLEVLDDLRIELITSGGTTAGHLHDGPEGLLFDVERPVMLMRQLRRAGRSLPSQRTPGPAGLPDVQLRAGGRRLAVVRLTPPGTVGIRPTAVGLITAFRALIPDTAQIRIPLAVTSALGATVVFALRRRRRTVAP